MNERETTATRDRGPTLAIGPIRIERVSELFATGVVLAAAGVSPLMFVATAAGTGSMNLYAKYALLPAVFIVIAVALLARLRKWEHLYHGIVIAAVAGPVASVGLEVVRVIGFRVFHAMPGSMPMLIGVLITNRLMLGPNLLSNVVGWADHIVANGIGFALVYVLIFGHPRWWKAVPYAWVIATVFMISPAMTMLGDIGDFGLAMGPGFAVTVYVAHTVFGLLLGAIVTRWGRATQPLWSRHFGLRGRVRHADPSPDGSPTY